MSGTGRRRESFDAVAAEYDSFRPSPPSEVVDGLTAAARLHPGCTVLEIGCGTGQFTVPLAVRGFEVVAIELGPHLAAHARQNLEGFSAVRVQVGSFEQWDPDTRQFDAVVCANAFHWLDPSTRVSKAASCLRAGGALAIVHVHHVRGGTPGFFEATQPFHMEWGLSDDPFFQPSRPDAVPTIYPELGESGEFDSIERTRWEIPTPHSTASYVGWLRTDSLVSSLDGDAREGFLRDIELLIESEYGGSVTRNFVYDLAVARRVP